MLQHDLIPVNGYGNICNTIYNDHFEIVTSLASEIILL